MTRSDYSHRVQEIFAKHLYDLGKKTDQMFGALFIFQWLIGVLFSVLVSPSTWAGSVSRPHLHVYSAIFLGAALVAFPLYLIIKNPGATINRYVVAVTQMLFSILLIHLTGGRIETHFHIFGSLAFLAFYHDWKLLLIATAVTGLDHLFRGLYLPQSVYGVLSATPWRALEHAAWVLFEDIFLFIAISRGIEATKVIAEKQVELENSLATVEEQVRDRTRQLQDAQAVVLNQQQALFASAKMSALGEMAGGIAHEINNPLAVLHSLSSQIEEEAQQQNIDFAFLKESSANLTQMTNRIGKIVQGLRAICREGSHDPFQEVVLETVISETRSLCNERFKRYGIDLVVETFRPDLRFEGRATEISQVLLNLLNNSHDAVVHLPVKWVKLAVIEKGDFVEIHVTDSGNGIKSEHREKVFQPFFTTKEIGKGTGLGLSISRTIIQGHQGDLYIDDQSPNTNFVVRLPYKQQRQSVAA